MAFNMERLRAASIAILMLAIPASRLFAQAGEPAPRAGAAVALAPSGAAAIPLMPEIISTYGASVDWLFYLILGITLFMMILVFALFLLFVVKYRHQEGRRAKFVHGNTRLEWIWTSATAAVLLWLVFEQRDTWNEIKQKDLATFENPYVVRVFAEQFGWHFLYPGPDGKFEPSDEKDIFPGINPLGLKDPKADKYSSVLMVPENVPVICELISLGKYDQESGKSTLPVLHSFFQPNLRFKQDLVPFHPAKIWFQILPGTLRSQDNGERKFEIACAELCGLGHYTMRADLQVLSEEKLKAGIGYDWKTAKGKF